MDFETLGQYCSAGVWAIFMVAAWLCLLPLAGIGAVAEIIRPGIVDKVERERQKFISSD